MELRSVELDISKCHHMCARLGTKNIPEEGYLKSPLQYSSSATGQKEQVNTMRCWTVTVQNQVCELNYRSANIISSQMLVTGLGPSRKPQPNLVGVIIRFDGAAASERPQIHFAETTAA